MHNCRFSEAYNSWKGCRCSKMAKGRKNMATKKVKQILEQCRAVAIEGKLITVAILKQRQRKLSARYL